MGCGRGSLQQRVSEPALTSSSALDPSDIQVLHLANVAEGKARSRKQPALAGPVSEAGRPPPTVYQPEVKPRVDCWRPGEAGRRASQQGKDLPADAVAKPEEGSRRASQLRTPEAAPGPRPGIRPEPQRRAESAPPGAPAAAVAPRKAAPSTPTARPSWRGAGATPMPKKEPARRTSAKGKGKAWFVEHARYDDYFGLPYPLPKLDMIAIPEFAAGAMENWGLVTYREVDLLIGEGASRNQMQRVCIVVTHANASVESLKQRAQTALCTGRGRLLNSLGEVLDEEKTIAEAKLKSDDVLTLHVNQVQLIANRRGDLSAFAALLGDGSVVTWGGANCCGDSSAVQDQLRDVQQIQASRLGFAVILGDGSVDKQGNADCGGGSSAVQDQLQDVQQIQDQLRDVQQIQASRLAFAVILGDGSVVAWADADYGGDSSVVQDQLQDVQQIQSSHRAFAAILGDGSVDKWGNADCGGDSSAVRISCEMCSRSNLLVGHLLQSWVTDLWSRGVMPTMVATAVQDQLRDVQQIESSHKAFAAILLDGSVVTWGNADHGGDSSAVQDQLRDVQQIQSSHKAFAAILFDGSVVTWGDADCGGDSSAVQDQLRDVQQVQSAHKAFAAILGDGAWGDALFGGDSSAAQDQLANMQQCQVLWRYQCCAD
eukprot:s1401_g7.t3